MGHLDDHLVFDHARRLTPKEIGEAIVRINSIIDQGAPLHPLIADVRAMIRARRVSRLGWYRLKKGMKLLHHRGGSPTKLFIQCVFGNTHIVFVHSRKEPNVDRRDSKADPT